jgi:hypothetical protein
MPFYTKAHPCSIPFCNPYHFSKVLLCPGDDAVAKQCAAPNKPSVSDVFWKPGGALPGLRKAAEAAIGGVN